MCTGMAGNDAIQKYTIWLHMGIERFFDWGAHIRTIDNANCWTQHKNAVVMGISGNGPQGNLLNEVESAFKVIL